MTLEVHPAPLLSSHPAPESPHQLPLEATVCMADKEPSSSRAPSGGRSTQQKSVVRGQSVEADAPRLLPAKTVPGSANDRRPRDTCSPCCERKALHVQTGSTVWPWDSYVSVNGDVSLQERLLSRGCPREEERSGAYSGLCCPSKVLEDPPARSSAASPRLWNTPSSEKVPGTLRSWTSTVSR